MNRLLLASASPARAATLASAGIAFDVCVSGVDEDAVLAAARAAGDLEPGALVTALARAKAEAVADGAAAAGHLVLGCDSMFFTGGELAGKPGSPGNARRRIAAMAGSSGVLYTGHWLIDRRTADGQSLGQAAATTVHVGAMSPDEIEAYVATGEPLSVAGSFTIDGLGGPFIDGIEGDHHAVVGLSLPLLRRLLAAIAVPIYSLWDIQPR